MSAPEENALAAVGVTCAAVPRLGDPTKVDKYFYNTAGTKFRSERAVRRWLATEEAQQSAKSPDAQRRGQGQ